MRICNSGEQKMIISHIFGFFIKIVELNLLKYLQREIFLFRK